MLHLQRFKKAILSEPERHRKLKWRYIILSNMIDANPYEYSDFLMEKEESEDDCQDVALKIVAGLIKQGYR